MSLCALGLNEAAAEIHEGRISSAELVTACLDRIAEVEPDVQAFAFLDRDHALRQAKTRDEFRAIGDPVGPAGKWGAKSCRIGPALVAANGARPA